eukprot:NODE_7125_length_604_cov_46.394130_g7102_i0.p2 GENE.NODE_7125_length_604_cov_46.394130_g7102_i0~~NODE_7125_length_604_cov_46.394130_g7102_i0.p2  ORF type:complete len:159 (-),score=41.25 NODE_7125_length_604_cov_46.394130_g7102_i0:44-520(-)
MTDLKTKFEAFCSFGAGKGGAAEMDNSKFAKFCRDCKLIDKKFTSTDADLIFTKSKKPGARKLDYTTFKTKTLPLIAEKRGQTADQLEAFIVGSAGPASNSTKAEAVKFHDDKSLYTGVYANGGPSTIDKDKMGLADIVADHDALTCNVRGVVGRMDS